MSDQTMTADDMRRDGLRRKRLLCAGVWFLVLMLVGCVGSPPPRNLFNPAERSLEAPPTSYDDRPWATVLRRYVSKGMVDYRRLAQQPQSLDAYINHVARVGPKSAPALFASRVDRLAYYLNVYNACVIKVVLSQDVPETLHDVRKSRRLERGYRFRIDGEAVTLAGICEMARSQSGGDARVELGLCDGAIGSPPIPNQPFVADGLSDRLNRLAREAMGNPTMVRIDHDRQQLLVSLAIWTHRDAFVRQYCRETASKSATMLNCLMHMAGRARRDWLTRATGYDVRLLPFERALNIGGTKSGAS